MVSRSHCKIRTYRLLWCLWMLYSSPMGIFYLGKSSDIFR